MSNDAFNTEALDEAMALIKALAPKKAPDDLMFIRGTSGLNIIVNKMLPCDSIIVSEDLFDKIYEASCKQEG